MKSVSVPLWFVWLTVIGSVIGAINGVCFIWTSHELKESQSIVHMLCDRLRYGDHPKNEPSNAWYTNLWTDPTNWIYTTNINPPQPVSDPP